jgi:hypothetical protein
MVLHHIDDIEATINKLYSLLNAGRYLAFADLTEDGSYHSLDIKIHLCFDFKIRADMLKKAGLKNVEHSSYCEVKCESVKNYALFLMIAEK